MTNPLNKLFLNENYQISFSAIVILNLLLSAWLIAITPTINNDGILYLITAQNYLSEGLSSAFASYSWPFYSICFAIISDISGLPLLFSAQLITTLGFTLLSYAFVRLVAAMGGNQRTQYIALFVILFQPLYANYRATLMRDPIFLGFMLLSLVELIRYHSNPTFKTIIKWASYSALSFLARPEAIIISALTPLSMLLCTNKTLQKNLVGCLHFYATPLLILFFISVTALALSPDILNQTKPFQDAESYIKLLTSLHSEVTNIAKIVADTALIHSAKDDAVSLTYIMLSSISLINILSVLTPIYTALLIYAMFFVDDAITISKPAKWVIINALLITLFYLLVFTLSRRFSLERYSFHSAVFLLLFIPFIVNHLLLQHGKKVKIAIYIIAACYFLDTIHNTNYKKTYIKDAAQWIQHNNPDNLPIITNVSHIAYFGNPEKANNRGASESSMTILKGKLKKDYIYAVEAKGNLSQLEKLAERRNVKKLQVIKSGTKKSVLIFKLKNKDIKEKIKGTPNS
ncbi:hypothetical protein [Oceanicoccus sp. KOV_DT_Chl]|uniref:hypothetical protein n=1 Tax=Oceanicoccus sp. KOV_DT_Chl TaxID=1904639 RepID=UPI000C7C189E|nr:hypothetical protein [Oceanicoccus sp. KOV_DT_Chl]